MTQQKGYPIVRFDNRLIYQASYYLPTRALRMLYHVIAKYVDPRTKELPRELHLPVSEIEAAIKNRGAAQWKNFYREVEKLCEDLTNNPIRFKSEVEIKGKKMKGYLNWCSSALVYRNETGNVFIRLGFDNLLSQFLVGLTEYVRLNRTEISRLQRPHAIRLFEMLKGIRNRRRQYEQLAIEVAGKTYKGVSVETYAVEDLKFLFGISEQYKLYKHFKRQVIDRSVRDINQHTSIRILQVEGIRKKRKITSLAFYFVDQAPEIALPLTEKHRAPTHKKDQAPTAQELESLTWAQHLAYQELLQQGVYAGIAFYQFLPSIKGSVFKGFEDHFVKLAWQHFKQWTTTRKKKSDQAAVFVTWWTKMDIFSPQSEVWVKILEQVQHIRKELEKAEIASYDNRIMAAEMTEGAFKAWYRSRVG